MEDLLNQLHLSNEAIKIYMKILGRAPFSSYELYSIVPELTKENFENLLSELIDSGLLVPIIPHNQNEINQYLAIPPFNPITNYYANINSSLDNIKHQLHQLLANSLKRIFKENPVIEMDTIYKDSHNLRKDLEEDTIIQKQDIEDIIIAMENLKIIKDILDDLSKTVKGIVESQLANLIKIITGMKKDIIEKVKLLELRKHEKEIIYILDQVFKDQFDKVVGDFTATLLKNIEDEFKNTLESVNSIIFSTLQLRDELKMLLLNMLNLFENNVNKLIDVIKAKKESLSDDMDNFESIINTKFSSVVSKSIESVAGLNKPIDKAMKNYFKVITSNVNLGLNEILSINSISRVNEEIKNAILNAQNDLSVVVPKLDPHISIEDFINSNSTLKTKIASSEAHTNSLVKKYKEIKNLEFKTLKNDNVIILVRDNIQFLIGIIQYNSEDTLQDFIGFSTNYIPLLKLFNPVIKSIWEVASSSLHETPKSIGIESSPKRENMSQPRAIKTIRTEAAQKKVKEKPKKTDLEPKQVQPEPEEVESPAADTITDLTKSIQKQVNFTSQTPLNSESSIEIDNAFRILVEQLPNLKGEEFSEELDKIAELILEKKGFSVTLHKIRSKINQYQTQVHLSDVDINHIIENIEEWKKKLL